MSFFLSNGSPTPLPLSSQDRDLLSTKASPTALREIPEDRRLMRSDPVSSRVASILCKGDWPSWGSRTLAACPQRPAGGLGGGGRERAGTAPDSASQGRRPPHEAQTGPPVGPCPARAADGARRTARPAVCCLPRKGAETRVLLPQGRRRTAHIPVCVGPQPSALCSPLSHFLRRRGGKERTPFSPPCQS